MYGGGGGGIISPAEAADNEDIGMAGAASWSGDASDWVAEEGAVVAVEVEDMKETGLALTVGQSEAGEEEMGLSLRDVVELVSDIRGEYLRCKAGLLLATEALPVSMFRTRLVLLAATTFAVLMMTGEARARTGVAGTRPSPVASGIVATGFEAITAVEG